MSIVTPQLQGVEGFNNGYEFYDASLAEVNGMFPQRQGLSEEDFDAVIQQADTVATPYTDLSTGVHLVPQLAQVRSYSWLNEELYAARYPEAVATDNLRHFTDVAGIKPGQAVRDALGMLAASRGVLVFDYPDIDEEYPQRVQALIERSGGQIVEAEQLGAQTYYAGRIRKAAGFDANAPVLSMQEGLLRLRAAGEIPHDLPTDGATYVETVDEETASHLYDIYADAFSVLNDHPCRQGFTPEEFREVMTSEVGKDIGKLILMSGGEVANMVMFSHELPYEWLNPRAYQNLLNGNYPIDKAAVADMKGGQILYFPAIATNPKNRKGLDSQPVIDLLARAVDASNNEVVVGFDCCDFNKDVLGLPKYIARLINGTEHATTDGFVEIGQQRYMGYSLAPAN
jgi:hypothetical protein